MTNITTPIIPVTQTFAKVRAPHELHLEAICVFAATGFFLDRDTYWKDEVVLPAGSRCELDTEGYLKGVQPWFQWHHRPRAIGFDKVLEEFTELFHHIVAEQVEGKQVILPLSGGLDSRSQAIALKRLNVPVQAYSYQFEHGYAETAIAKQIAETCDFEFRSYTIPKGYLWSSIDALADINGCYSDFCSPRQMAVVEPLKQLEGVFSLGHWGDVLFDDIGVVDTMPFQDQVAVVIKKISKRGGLVFAQGLWEAWGLEGQFYDYFYARVEDLLRAIDIPDSANARIRAFKSLYWAPRWTSVNLSVFDAIHPIHLPYYDNRMCEFVCGLPEAFLSGRQLQIAYIKQQSPELAQLTWDFYHPYNLYTYTRYKSRKGFGQRLLNSMVYRSKLLMGKTIVQRNWELQFLGEDNESHLKGYLFSNEFSEFIPVSLTASVYEGFRSKQQLVHAHAINMLLTMSKWYSKKE